jgi:hypothetical protein
MAKVKIEMIEVGFMTLQEGQRTKSSGRYPSKDARDLNANIAHLATHPRNWQASMVQL